MPPRSKKAVTKGKSSKKQNAGVQERSIQRDEPLDIPRIAVTSEITDVAQRSRSPSRVDDSVIMLSSAETTRVELNDQDPSLMMLTGIDLSRPSTRLGHTDMTLEETGLCLIKCSEIASLSSFYCSQGEHRYCVALDRTERTSGPTRAI